MYEYFAGCEDSNVVKINDEILCIILHECRCNLQFGHPYILRRVPECMVTSTLCGFAIFQYSNAFSSINSDWIYGQWPKNIYPSLVCKYFIKRHTILHSFCKRNIIASGEIWETIYAKCLFYACDGFSVRNTHMWKTGVISYSRVSIAF